jgi:predicted transcriptional regulator
MSKSKLKDVDVCRIWDMHKLGVPNVKIAAELGVSERTVRYHLGRGNENAPGAFSSLSPSETERKDTIIDILDRQILMLSRKLQEAEDVKITKTSEFLKAAEATFEAIALRNTMSANANNNASSAPQKLAPEQLKPLKELPEDVRRKLIKELKSRD